MSEQIKADVIIIGAGIAGLTLALRLAAADMHVHIVEKSPPPAFDAIKPSGRTAALFGGSVDMIQACGVWDRVAPFCDAMHGLRIVDGDTDVLFRASDIGHERFGYNVPNMILRTALYEKATKSQNITVHDGVSVQSIETHRAHVDVVLENDTVLSVPLLVGADGRESFVRHASGIQTKDTDYGQTALTFLIRHDRPHNNISTEFHKPGGPLALVPLPDNTSSVVWVEKSEQTNALLSLKKQELATQLQKLTHSALGSYDIITPVQSWPLKMIVAQTLTARRTALIAEAAHVMPPISAQGLNLSLRDVRDLADTIIQFKRTGLDIGSATLLQKYESLRTPDIIKRTRGVHTLNSVVMYNDTFTGRAKRLGLEVLQTMPVAKRAVMQALMV